MALSNEKERELLSSLNSAYNRFNKLEEQNRQIKRRNEELAKQTLEGQKYFRSVEKYEKRRSRNLQTRRMIVAACITLAAVVVLLIATITAWQIVVGNLSAIKAPFADNDQSGWTDEQYGVLYTLGILLFVAVVIGLIAASIGGTMSKKSINILGWAYIALGIAAYIGLIIYTLTVGEAANKWLGIFLPLVIPLTLVMAPFNCGGVGESYLAMMPSIIAIIVTLLLIGGVYILLVNVIWANATKIKATDSKLEALKKERDEAYIDYQNMRDKFHKENKLLDTSKEWSEISRYRQVLDLPATITSDKISQMLWCIENRYADNIKEANNWLYNEENRKRAEAETTRFRAKMSAEVSSMHNDMNQKLDEQNENIKNVGKEIKDLRHSIENKEIKIENKMDIDIEIR